MHQDEPSLLSHLNLVRSNTISEGGLSTLIYCGKIRTESELAAALQVHREIVETEVNKNEGNITGILIGQGNSVLHMLEGPSTSVLRILNKLAGHDHFTVVDAIQSGNIVYCVEDRPKRFFPEWYSCVIQERKSQGEEVTEENCNDLVFAMATKFLEIGDRLQTEAQEELELSKYTGQLPSKSLILALATSNCFFSLESFVRFYYDPYHVELESEQTWPLERLVQY